MSLNVTLSLSLNFFYKYDVFTIYFCYIKYRFNNPISFRKKDHDFFSRNPHFRTNVIRSGELRGKSRRQLCKSFLIDQSPS